MLRKTLAWTLIVVGLASLAGSVGMAIIFTIGDDVAAKNAQVDAAMDPNNLNLGGRRQADNDPVMQYGSAALSILIGGAIAFAGFRLRTPRAARGMPTAAS